MSAALSRRALLGGAGKVGAAAALAASTIVASAVPAASGYPAILAGSHPDGEIGEALVMWHHTLTQWRVESQKRDLADAVSNSFDAKSDQYLDRIATLPAQTIEGMAIKSYVAFWRELGSHGDTWMDIDFQQSGWLPTTVLNESVAADALRLSPLLASIVGAEA